MTFPTEHQLLPRYAFLLTAWDQGGERFIRLFRSCWKQLPRGSRRAIATFWKGGGKPYPVVELSNLWSDSEEKSFAQVSHGGTVLKFSAKDFAVFPDSIARWVIAHELAHVYQKTRGRTPGGRTEQENEQEADRIAASWGFDKTPTTLLFLALCRRLSVEEACKEIVRDGLG